MHGCVCVRLEIIHVKCTEAIASAIEIVSVSLKHGSYLLSFVTHLKMLTHKVENEGKKNGRMLRQKFQILRRVL